MTPTHASPSLGSELLLCSSVLTRALTASAQALCPSPCTETAALGLIFPPGTRPWSATLSNCARAPGRTDKPVISNPWPSGARSWFAQRSSHLWASGAPPRHLVDFKVKARTETQAWHCHAFAFIFVLYPLTPRVRLGAVGFIARELPAV